MGINNISRLFKFIPQPNSLLLEDQSSETRSKEHNQTVFVFVKLGRLKIDECIYAVLHYVPTFKGS